MASAIPNFRDVRTKRAIITTSIGTLGAVVILVPAWNKFVAPTIAAGINKVKAAGFLPSA